MACYRKIPVERPADSPETSDPPRLRARVSSVRQQSIRNLNRDAGRRRPSLGFKPRSQTPCARVSSLAAGCSPLTGPLGLPRWCCKFNHLHTWRLHGTPITGRSSGAWPSAVIRGSVRTPFTVQGYILSASVDSNGPLHPSPIPSLSLHRWRDRIAVCTSGDVFAHSNWFNIRIRLYFAAIILASLSCLLRRRCASSPKESLTTLAPKVKHLRSFL